MEKLVTSNVVCCCRPDAATKVAKTDEYSNPNQYNNAYDGSTDYSSVAGYAANSAYNYNTAQWPGYGNAQQQVSNTDCAFNFTPAHT